MRMSKLYKKIAKKHGVSPEVVKRDMEAAVKETFKLKGQEPPSVESFIKSAANQALKNK